MNTPYFAGRYAFIDIETTGLDPKTDAIIEIGVSIIEDDREVDSYQTLIDPGNRPVPLRVQRLTGIQPSDLRGRPALSQAIDELKRFVGSSPCIAHNADFERKFFHRAGFTPAVWMDSILCASLLVPHLGSMALESLLRASGLRHTESHRGLDDARDTFRMLLHGARNCGLSKNAWKQILSVLEPIDDPWLPFFRRVASSAGSGRPRQREGNRPAGTCDALAEPAAEAFLRGGIIERTLGLSHRPGQATMAEAVECTLENNGKRMIEAGTGSGKSLAYLYPAVRTAIRNRERIAVTTHTKLLQHQIADRELPRLRAVFPALKWATVKGRDNYLCLTALDTRIAGLDLLTDPADRWILAVMIAFGAHPDSSGELDRLPGWFRMRFPSFGSIVADVRSSGLKCAGTCEHGARCFFQDVMRDADEAHVLVINHALALRWPLQYPAFRRIVVDEAHTIEDAASAAYGDELSETNLAQTHRRFWGEGKHRGLADRLLQVLPDTDDNRDLIGRIEALSGENRAFRTLVDTLKEQFVGILFGSDPRTDCGDETELRRSADLLTGVSPDRLNAVRDIARNVFGWMASIVSICEKARKTRSGWRVSKPHIEALDMDLAIAEQLTKEQCRILGVIVLVPRGDYCNWVEATSVRGKIRWVLKTQPIDVAMLLHDNLWKEMKSAILTSATLSAGRNERFIERRIGFSMGASPAPMLVIPSPFDYTTRMLAIAPLDANVQLAEKRRYIETQAILASDLARVSGGRMLFLSTNRERSGAIGSRMGELLRGDAIDVLVQGSGNRESLLDELRRERGSVVVGLDSFWEGVDVPGTALVSVVIERIPFKSQDEPLIGARVKRLNDRINAFAGFSGYLLPIAILKLRQGVGRLIRDTGDFGVVILFGGLGKATYTDRVRGAFPVDVTSIGPWRAVLDKVRRHLVSWRLDGLQETH